MYEPCVHHILLSEVVEADNGVAVGYVLSLEHSLASKLIEPESQIKGRKNVLRGPHSHVHLFLFVLCKQGSPIGEFRVRSLRVVLRERRCGEAVVAVRSVENRIVLFFAFEVVVVLGGRTAHSLPGDIHVVTELRDVIEPVVETGVLLLIFELLEVLVDIPNDYSFVLERIRECEGFEDTRRVLAHAVLVGLDAVLAVHYTVAAVE